LEDPEIADLYLGGNVHGNGNGKEAG